MHNKKENITRLMVLGTMPGGREVWDMEKEFVTYQDVETARILRCLAYAKLFRKKNGMSEETDQEELASNK